MLEEALAGVDPPLPPGADGLLLDLFRLLGEWKGAGITGFRSAADLANLYFREALALRSLLPPGGRFLDVGSGAGTPALPLAAALETSHWTLLEPRATAAGFLELAVESLNLGSRIRVLRTRLENCLERDEERDALRASSAVTLRAVRLRAVEWRGLAAALPPEAVVVWPTSEAGRARADIPVGAFDEEIRPAARGIVWIGRPRTLGRDPDVSRETSNRPRRAW